MAASAGRRYESSGMAVGGQCAGPRQLARAEQQGIDSSLMCHHVQFRESAGILLSEAFGLVEGAAEVAMDRAGRRQRQRLAEVPEQLVELPHDGKHSEHLPGQAWLPPPVPPAEGHLSDLLPRAEA